MHLVIELTHLRYSSVLLKEDFVHVCTLVVVVRDIAIVDCCLKDLLFLICLSLFWKIVHVHGLRYHKVAILSELTVDGPFK